MFWYTVATLIMLWAYSGVALADDGAVIYEKKCKVCHSIAGVAGPMAKQGGPLDGVGSKRDEAWLQAYFSDPKSKIENAKMPKMKLSDEDWSAIVKYMLSLKEGAPSK
jgi:cytochrome c6